MYISEIITKKERDICLIPSKWILNILFRTIKIISVNFVTFHNEFINRNLDIFISFVVLYIYMCIELKQNYK